jgi:hypothetical protein
MASCLHAPTRDGETLVCQSTEGARKELHSPCTGRWLTVLHKQIMHTPHCQLLQSTPNPCTIQHPIQACRDTIIMCAWLSAQRQPLLSPKHTTDTQTAGEPYSSPFAR